MGRECGRKELQGISCGRTRGFRSSPNCDPISRFDHTAAWLYPFHYFVHNFACATLPAKVRRQVSTFPNYFVHCVLDASSTIAIPKLTEHERGRTDSSQWVGDILTNDVRGGSVDTGMPDEILLSSITFITHGSPITKLSPALIEGTRPREPTSAAAASLQHGIKRKEIPMTSNSRNNIPIKIGRDHHIINPERSHMLKLEGASFV